MSLLASHQGPLSHQVQLLDDPYLLAKFKSEIADKRRQAGGWDKPCL